MGCTLSASAGAYVLYSFYVSSLLHKNRLTALFKWYACSRRQCLLLRKRRCPLCVCIYLNSRYFALRVRWGRISYRQLELELGEHLEVSHTVQLAPGVSRWTCDTVERAWWKVIVPSKRTGRRLLIDVGDTQGHWETPLISCFLRVTLMKQESDDI